MVTADEFTRTQKRKHPGTVLTLKQEDNSSVVLENIVVPSSLRRTGVGSSIMQELARTADREGWVVRLEVDSVYGTPVPVLQFFYHQFGFVNSMPHRSSSAMVRSPQMLTERAGAEG